MVRKDANMGKQWLHFLLRIAIILIVIGLTIVGCQFLVGPPRAAIPRIDVVLLDSQIRLLQNVEILISEDVTFNVINLTDKEHALVLVAVTAPDFDLRGDKLPVGGDGKVDQSKLKIIASTSVIQPNTQQELTVRQLKTGHYILVSTLNKDYQDGMYFDLTFVGKP